MSSDTEHIAAKLDELFRHYERPDENFRYPDFESAPDGVDFGESFTLDNCEIISCDTRAVSPVLLKYEVGDYYLFIGFAPWDMFIETPEELAGIKWHPDTAYFIQA